MIQKYDEISPKLGSSGSLSRAKVKGNRFLRNDNERASSETSPASETESDSEREEQKTRKLKVKECSSAKADQMKKRKKPRLNNPAAYSEDDSHDVYDNDRMNLHTNNDND